MGGERAVYGITTLVVSTDSQRETPLGTTLVQTRTYYAFPLSVRREITLNGRTMAMASTPASGGVAFTPSGAMPLDEATRVAMERSTMRDPVVLMKSRLGRGFAAQHVGQEAIDGRTTDIVKLVQNDNETIAAVDRADGRLLEIRYRLKDEDGRDRALVVRFHDWTKLASGLVYPYAVQGFDDGKRVFENRVRDVQIEVPLAPTLFTAGFGAASGGRPLPQ